MKVCDKCGDLTPSTCTILIVEDDVRYDLCGKHAQQVTKLITTKDKKNLFGRKKDSAKAG